MQVLSVASVIPYIELPSAPDGIPVHLRESGGKTTVLITLHSAYCPGCREYLKRLAPFSGEFDVWDARLLTILPAPAAEAERLHPPFGKVLIDERGVLADSASAAVLVADRYGQIFEAARAGASHELPSPRELAEWLKYLGTLCPE